MFIMDSAKHLFMHTKSSKRKEKKCKSTLTLHTKLTNKNKFILLNQNCFP